MSGFIHFYFLRAYASVPSGKTKVPLEQDSRLIHLRRGRDYFMIPAAPIVIINELATPVFVFLQGLENEFSAFPKDKNSRVAGAHLFICGGEGIRTPDTVSCIQTFQACSLNHSDTPPDFLGLQI